MPDSVSKTITDDVIAVIKAASYVTAITVKRGYLPKYDSATDVPKQSPFLVHVLPSGVSVADMSRDQLAEVDYSIDVAVLGYVAEQNREQKIDTLLLLVEQIQNQLVSIDNARLSTSGAFLTMPAYEQPALYEPTALRENRLFFSVTTFKYRIARG